MLIGLESELIKLIRVALFSRYYQAIDRTKELSSTIYFHENKLFFT